MKGLIEEGSEVINGEGDPDVKDAALIAAAQRVEHYEIAGYGTVRTFAQRLAKHEAARLLQETLNEEAETDKKLTGLAEKAINPKAAAHAWPCFPRSARICPFPSLKRERRNAFASASCSIWAASSG
jgi:ferritin-like metal-binding protein YciE